MGKITFQSNKINHWHLITTGTGHFIIILSASDMLRQIFRPGNADQLGPLWLMILVFLVGIAIMIYGYFKMLPGKGFLEWNDLSISYWLPRQKKPEMILLSDISSLEVRHFDVVVTLIDGNQRILNLSNLLYNDLQKARQGLGELKI